MRSGPGPVWTGSGTRAASTRRLRVSGPGNRGTAGPRVRWGTPFPGIERLLPGIRRGNGLAGAGREPRPPGAGVAGAELADAGLAGAGLAGAGLAARSALPRDAGLTNGRARPFLPMRNYPPGMRASALPQ